MSKIEENDGEHNPETPMVTRLVVKSPEETKFGKEEQYVAQDVVISDLEASPRDGDDTLRDETSKEFMLTPRLTEDKSRHPHFMRSNSSVQNPNHLTIPDGVRRKTSNKSLGSIVDEVVDNASEGLRSSQKFKKITTFTADSGRFRTASSTNLP